MTYRDEFKDVQREAYWSLPRVAGWLIAVVLVLMVINFIGTGGDLAIYRFWAPKQENAKRVVFENTQSYVQGKTEHLTELQLDYSTADGSQKKMLRNVILREASTVDNSKLPVDLQVFINDLKTNSEPLTRNQ